MSASSRLDALLRRIREDPAAEIRMQARRLPERYARAVLSVARRLPEEAQRRIAISLVETRAESITFEQGELLWTGDVSDRAVAQYTFVHGPPQTQELLALVDLMRRRERFGEGRRVVLEVGANIGTTTVTLAANVDCDVIAVEPMPDNFELLRRNVALNGLGDRVACVHGAVVYPASHSSGVESVEMVRAGHNSGTGELYQSSGRQGFTGKYRGEAALSPVKVPAVSVDEVLESQGVQPNEVAFVWSDTQGAEAQVVRSGLSLWQSRVPLWVEVWPSGLGAQGGVGEFLEMTQTWFESFVTREAVLDGGDVRPRPIADLASVVERLEGYKYTDVLLLPE